MELRLGKVCVEGSGVVVEVDCAVAGEREPGSRAEREEAEGAGTEGAERLGVGAKGRAGERLSHEKSTFNPQQTLPLPVLGSTGFIGNPLPQEPH